MFVYFTASQIGGAHNQALVTHAGWSLGSEGRDVFFAGQSCPVMRSLVIASLIAHSGTQFYIFTMCIFAHLNLHVLSLNCLLSAL